MIDIKLNDKFDISINRVFISGTQALVRLCLLRKELDRKDGFNTAGYVTGYRGSPLGGLDQQFPRAKHFLQEANVIFEPALNEDLAATAIWGTQQAELRGEGAYDGVFCIWYGKGPGVDRSGDAFRHGNLAGTSKHGGVLVVMGDDHTCESSTTAHQSEFALKDAMIPILNPANVQEILDYGLHGWALSRYAGVWCGLKCVKDNVESTASIDAGPGRFNQLLSEDEYPEENLNIRLTDSPLEQEARLHRHKLQAARDYVRLNGLDKIICSGDAHRRIGIVSTGKSWMDTRQALDELGLSLDRANELGISLYKVAMTWPLEPTLITKFCEGLDLVIVVEEKRSLIEDQLKVELYRRSIQPIIVGKLDENNCVLFQSEAALNPMQIAEAIGQRVARLTGDEAVTARTAEITEMLAVERVKLEVQRKPWFCAGCPHNSSTVIPEGSRAYAGIGCHYLVQFMDRDTLGYTHMGGEGANWVGESRFSTRAHVFQNLGDGTYNHSGLMAIRSAIAANTHITFKLLYNDAVALTGGQKHDGEIDVYRMVSEIAGMGVQNIALISDDPSNLKPSLLPPGTQIEHRDRLITVQKSLARIEGVTVLVYEQICAAEKRRRRKRGQMEDPAVRVLINAAVCEGCGDCTLVSNCVAIAPLETELGRKRTIDQSACNKDLSCINGFCPSFVTILGGELRKPSSVTRALPDVPDPPFAASSTSKARLDNPYSILLTGVGGTGVVTIGAVIGMAAHLDNLSCGIIDMAGLAQKGGSVVSHLKLANTPQEINSIRVSIGGADLLMGCDLLVSNEESVVQCLSKGRSQVILNTNEMMPPEFTRSPDLVIPVNLMHRRLKDAVDMDAVQTVDATRIANGLLGDSIGANLFMLGVAWQRGLIPITRVAIVRAIELNNVAIEFNQRAFEAGRLWVFNAESLESMLDRQYEKKAEVKHSLQDILKSRTAELEAYQNTRYANRYRTLVEKVKAVDTHPEQEWSVAVAKYYFKLMAYKDEYEVARLYNSNQFKTSLEEHFSGDYSLVFNLAPPLFAKKDKDSGMILKNEYGQWMRKVFKFLAPFKVLRGTPADIFGYSQERRLERELVSDYQRNIEQLIENYDHYEYNLLVEFSEIPELIRGYGHVKMKSIEDTLTRQQELLQVMSKNTDSKLEPA